MDVPVLTAIIGVGGTLLGTIVGGCLTTFTNILVQKRRERAEFRTGCRLIDEEFWDNQSVVATMLNRRSWWAAVELTTDTWKEHRHILASYLPLEDWGNVQSAIHAVNNARFLRNAAPKDQPIPDNVARLLTKVVADIGKGRDSLQPYLRETKTRTIGSTQHPA